MLPLLITLQSFFVDTADRLKGEQKGATAVEYGMIVGLLAVLIIGVLVVLGPQLAALFQGVSDQLPDAP